MIRWQDAPAGPLSQPIESLRPLLGDTDAELVEARYAGETLVLVTAEAHAAAARHVVGKRDEQGGLLVGTPFAREPLEDAVDVVLVRIAVGALDFSSSGVSLRMEAGVWDRAREALSPGELVVGWFHSHPGLGAFFSETDRRTQAAFFAHPFSVGWVIDPYRDEEGWFLGATALSLTRGRVLRLLPGAAQRRL
jgi:proteasome lid subunit RPN8/RPN11